MEGGGEGNFRAAGIFFRHEIPCVNFFHIECLNSERYVLYQMNTDFEGRVWLLKKETVLLRYYRVKCKNLVLSAELVK